MAGDLYPFSELVSRTLAGFPRPDAPEGLYPFRWNGATEKRHVLTMHRGARLCDEHVFVVM
jgi:hypothetical protein